MRSVLAGTMRSGVMSGGHGFQPTLCMASAISVAAAVILADKSDVHRTRVRNSEMIKFDIHDRVNWAVEKSFLNVDENGKHITLELTIDPAISHVMEYFEIFMTRMLASRTAAKAASAARSVASAILRLRA